MPIIHHLIADQFGSHVGKYQGRLKVTKAKEVLAQAPLLHLESVTISNPGVSISAEAIRACVEAGIPIHFLSGSGSPYAALYSAGLTGTVLTRRGMTSSSASGCPRSPSVRSIGYMDDRANRVCLRFPIDLQIPAASGSPKLRVPRSADLPCIPAQP